MPNTKVVGIIFPYILTPIPNLYDHSFPRYGQITFLTFRRPTTLTFDLKFWSVEKWLRYYTLKFCENTDKQTHKHTNKHTNTQTDMGITIPRPPPMGGRGNFYAQITRYSILNINTHSIVNIWPVLTHSPLHLHYKYTSITYVS